MFIILVCLTAGAGGVFLNAWSVRRSQERVKNAMKQMFAALQLYAEASDGNYYPQRATEPGKFVPDIEEWAKLGDGMPEFEAALRIINSDEDHPLCYLGYAFYDEASAQRLLDQLEMDPRAFRGGGTRLESEPFLDPASPELDEIHPLRKQVGRRFVQSWFVFAGMPPDKWRMADPIPVLWQMPRKKGDKVAVLHMSGFVEFCEYPGEFPMSPLFINRLRGLMGLPQDPGFSLDTPILPIVRDLLEAGSREPGRGVGSLLHFDAAPSVSADGAIGYRIKLTGGELVLFPEATAMSSISPGSLLERPGSDHYGLPYGRTIRYMGTSRGYHWYGEMSYDEFMLLNEVFGLSGGDSLYAAAASYCLAHGPFQLGWQHGSNDPRKPETICQSPSSLDAYMRAYVTVQENNQRPVPDEIVQAAAILCGPEHGGYGAFTYPSRELKSEAKERLVAAAQRDPEAAATLVLLYILPYQGRVPRSEATPDKIELLQRLPRDTVLSTVRHLAANLQEYHEAVFFRDLLEKLQESSASRDQAE